MLENKLFDLFGGSPFYAQLAAMFYQELLRLAEMYEWPPEWLNPPSTGELNEVAWLQRIEEYASGQSDRVAHIPALGRLSQVAVMALLGLSQTIDGDFLEALARPEAGNCCVLTGSQDVANPRHGHEGSTK